MMRWLAAERIKAHIGPLHARLRTYSTLFLFACIGPTAASVSFTPYDTIEQGQKWAAAFSSVVEITSEKGLATYLVINTVKHMQEKDS
ncbi:uncharacterized protein Z520_12178 [Fonsecaea multimorphosa CBS 102226]|uniref:Uncharacterized protein n=1 Tax=Fonsecaea multimorphosa CBS 102226 TaxID=1442371 RepID=A0A0D2JNM5_9EURO|nr:uncharacterized protein Z520_12178 [Fonsecaea multimorphosa CBS 102226]KIX92094.1 hypothetical protein Z520_12178 [Fonsecaea multimorphosa CBS 102226]